MKMISIQQNNLNHIVITIVILMMMNCVSWGNDILGQDKTLTVRFESKKWFTYVQKFLQNRLRKYIQNKRHHNYLPTIRSQIAFIKVWLQIIYNVKFSLWTWEQKANSTITYPMNKLRRLGHGENINGGLSKDYYYQIFTWKFTLSKYLRLNITFEHISIMYGKLHQCYIGKISVKSFAKNLSQQFNYCGIHSNVTIYPWYQNINIQVTLRPFVSYDVMLRYSVIDPDKIISYPANRHSKLVKWMFYVYLSSSREYKQKLHIQVEKFNCILIIFNDIKNSSHDVYDGPDSVSNQLNPNNKSTYTTSAFQCMVYISSHLFITNTSLKYYSKVNTITNYVNITQFQNLFLNFPSNSSTFLSIVKLRTKATNCLNISITNFTNNYKYNSSCNYVGIAFYEQVKNVYIEKRSMCLDGGDFYKHRNIYSIRSEMLLVMYSFQYRGSMYISLNISTTQCRLNLVDRYLCQYNMYCSPEHGYFGKYKDLCKYLIKGSGSDESIHPRHSHGSAYQTQDFCVIHQFTQEVDLFLYKIVAYVRQRTTCRFSFQTYYLIHKRKIMTYHASGFFTGMCEK